MFKFSLLLFLFLAAAIPVLASDVAGEIAEIRSRLAERLPEHTPDFIEPSPIPGVYQVGFGTQIVYVSADGRYAMQGMIFDLEDNRKNLTEETVAKARLRYQSELDATKGIVFAPKKVRHSITVFTDIDCPYCVKLHNEMAALNGYGIEVKYLLFPRAGVGSSSFDKAVSVWCADDRNQAITQAKAGQTLPKKVCENPVEQHYQLGQKIGVSGTPAILLQDGTLIPGYQPAKQMAEMLDAK
jgi:thiol:disulfide interchange protein DsbC